MRFTVLTRSSAQRLNETAHHVKASLMMKKRAEKYANYLLDKTYQPLLNPKHRRRNIR